MRHFKGIISFAHAEAAQYVAFLHKRLDHAVEVQSGLQQGDASLQDLIAMEDAVRDIAAAMLGREIIMGASCGFYPAPPSIPEDFQVENLTEIRRKAAEYDDLHQKITDAVNNPEGHTKISRGCRISDAQVSGEFATFVVSPGDRALFEGKM